MPFSVTSKTNLNCQPVDSEFKLDWVPVAHLQLPASASDGRHRDRQHLRSSYSALERLALEDMPDVSESCPWALRVSLPVLYVTLSIS
jgi:hypothetical protein